MSDLFIEFGKWGWNAITIGFIGTIVFTVFQGWGLIEQLRTIKVKRSGKSIPVLFYASFVGVYLSFGLYGCKLHSLAMILNGFLGFLYLRVYFAAVKFDDSDGWRIWHGIFLLLIPLMFFSSYPKTLMALILLGACGMLIQSPYEIFQKKSAGAVEPRYLATFAASASFWIIYTFSIGDWVVFASNVFAIVAMAVTFWLWSKYKPVPQQSN